MLYLNYDFFVFFCKMCIAYLENLSFPKSKTNKIIPHHPKPTYFQPYLSIVKSYTYFCIATLLYFLPSWSVPNPFIRVRYKSTCRQICASEQQAKVFWCSESGKRHSSMCKVRWKLYRFTKHCCEYLCGRPISLILFCLGRSSKGQHSAPRGGPPRSWTNDDLTKALENVWNKRMTTSQASRIFGIPYNSLLMYVRGKYGKSLRLDVLKKNTPAANDDLNVIGNSRSTPNEKAAGVKKEDGYGKDRGRKPSQESGIGGPLSGLFPNFAEGHSFNPFSNGLLFPPPGEPSFPGLLGFPPSDPRIKELMQSLQAQHSARSQTERIKEESFSDTKENNENGSKSGFQIGKRPINATTQTR